MADDAVTDLDPARYLRAPVLDVPGAIALGIALLSSTDGSLSGAPHASAKRLRARVLELQARWAEQRAVASTPKTDPRPADQRLDRAWAAVGRRLETLSELPETVPEAKLAATLYERLFPEGLTFLAMAFEKQWAESEQRLKQIGDGPTAKQLTTLVGDFLLAELRTAHTEYGRVLGITAAKAEKATPPSLVEALRGVTQAIAAYSLQLVAAAHADPEIVPAVRRALRPLDDIRSAQSRRAAAGESPSVPDDTIAPPPSKVGPTTPVPDV
ncbi:MAG: hypothetical protein BGO98_28835 [Myxococcales bacterium 68-20]|nr:hypothetical protein [Myxococcales bacterium]OJY30776.1 MAG: hypothetical protein BGO98_28835 [Myxococcales bacterium 68-20]